MDSVVGKIQKHVDALKTKNTKLADENAKLKAQLTTAKQLNSRIRRIAKKPTTEPTDNSPAAAAAAATE
jgi:regulator of replication initiation timing